MLLFVSQIAFTSEAFTSESEAFSSKIEMQKKCYPQWIESATEECRPYVFEALGATAPAVTQVSTTIPNFTKILMNLVNS